MIVTSTLAPPNARRRRKNPTWTLSVERWTLDVDCPVLPASSAETGAGPRGFNDSPAHAFCTLAKRFECAHAVARHTIAAMQSIRTLVAVFLLACSALAADPPPLRKPDAKRVLEFMEWREVTIITVHQGVNAKGTAAPIYAHVVALGTRDSRHQHISQTLYYDDEYGWFFYELGEKSVRMWTKDGYKEIKPWSTW